MARLKKADPEMFEEVYKSLLHDMDPERPKEEWRRIFEPGWPREEDYCGYVLLSGDEVVGFLGLIFATMVVDGRPERLCNVTTWVVRDGHGAEASWLLFPLREMSGYTVTNLTPDDATFRAFTRLGFDILETHVRTFLPPLVPRRGRQQRGCHVLLDPHEIAGELEEPDRKLLRDHLPYARHAMLLDDGGYCYCIYTVVRRHGLRRANLQYMSDRERLVAHLPELQNELFRAERLALVECDERFVRDMEGLPWSYRQQIDTPELYRSARLSREEVTGLYSELLLLGLRV